MVPVMQMLVNENEINYSITLCVLKPDKFCTMNATATLLIWCITEPTSTRCGPIPISRFAGRDAIRWWDFIYLLFTIKLKY